MPILSAAAKENSRAPPSYARSLAGVSEVRLATQRLVHVAFRFFFSPVQRQASKAPAPRRPNWPSNHERLEPNTFSLNHFATCTHSTLSSSQLRLFILPLPIPSPSVNMFAASRIQTRAFSASARSVRFFHSFPPLSHYPRRQAPSSFFRCRWGPSRPHRDDQLLTITCL